MEKTLVLIKPDVVSKKNVGKILSVYEEDGLKIESIKILIPDSSLLHAHYSEHTEKPFFSELMAFMMQDRLVAMILSGDSAISRVRKLNGATNPLKADEGTIRFLFGTDVTQNAVHGSANRADALKEISLWFPELTQ